MFKPNPEILKDNLSRVRELPVLMYHRVAAEEPPPTGFNLHVSQSAMDRQLCYLRSHGFVSIGFMDLLGRPLPRKPVILTFDDGYEDLYHYLFPLLGKYRMKAVLYLLGNRRPRNNFWDLKDGYPEASLLKPSQIKEMLRSGLVEFGAHSMSHSDLTALSPGEIRKEIGGSKKALESFLKIPVVSFAYPYGAVNSGIKAAAAREGFSFGVAVDSGPVLFAKDLLEIRRIMVFSWTSLLEYRVKTSGFCLRLNALPGYQALGKFVRLLLRLFA